MSMTEAMTSREGMKPGQDLVVAGYAGLDGASQIAREREAVLLEHFTKQFVRRCQIPGQNTVFPGAEVFYEAGAADLEPVKDGGIMAALWRLFEEYGLGFEIELRDIPILQETVEVCEIFDLNPYRLRSEGCVILAADNGRDLVRNLNKRGIDAVVIGKVEPGIKRQILNGDIRSFLDMPKPDELYKI